VRGLNTLFGGGHAAIFMFPMDLHNWGGRKPDPANGFWYAKYLVKGLHLTR